MIEVQKHQMVVDINDMSTLLDACDLLLGEEDNPPGPDEIREVRDRVERYYHDAVDRWIPNFDELLTKAYKETHGG